MSPSVVTQKKQSCERQCSTVWVEEELLSSRKWLVNLPANRETLPDKAEGNPVPSLF
jgi:hypothetical protein